MSPNAINVSENHSSLPPRRAPLFPLFLATTHYSFAFFLIAAAEPLSKVVFVVVVVVPMATLAVVGATTPAPAVEDLLNPAC